MLKHFGLLRYCVSNISLHHLPIDQKLTHWETPMFDIISRCTPVCLAACCSVAKCKPQQHRKRTSIKHGKKDEKVHQTRQKIDYQPNKVDRMSTKLDRKIGSSRSRVESPGKECMSSKHNGGRRGVGTFTKRDKRSTRHNRQPIKQNRRAIQRVN